MDFSYVWVVDFVLRFAYEFSIKSPWKLHEKSIKLMWFFICFSWILATVGWTCFPNGNRNERAICRARRESEHRTFEAQRAKGRKVFLDRQQKGIYLRLIIGIRTMLIVRLQSFHVITAWSRAVIAKIATALLNARTRRHEEILVKHIGTSSIVGQNIIGGSHLLLVCSWRWVAGNAEQGKGKVW
jgi:hypothetical protein